MPLQIKNREKGATTKKKEGMELLMVLKLSRHEHKQTVPKSREAETESCTPNQTL